MIPLSKLEVYPKIRINAGVCHQYMPVMTIHNIGFTEFEWPAIFSGIYHVERKLAREFNNLWEKPT